jgi:hypothetical protein
MDAIETFDPPSPAARRSRAAPAATRRGAGRLGSAAAAGCGGGRGERSRDTAPPWPPRSRYEGD